MFDNRHFLTANIVISPLVCTLYH